MTRFAVRATLIPTLCALLVLSSCAKGDPEELVGQPPPEDKLGAMPPPGAESTIDPEVIVDPAKDIAWFRECWTSTSESAFSYTPEMPRAHLLVTATSDGAGNVSVEAAPERYVEMTPFRDCLRKALRGDDAHRPLTSRWIAAQAFRLSGAGDRPGEVDISVYQRTEGGLSEAQLDAEMRRIQPNLQVCYQRVLKAAPSERGAIFYAFRVGEFGEPVKPEVLSTIEHPNFPVCVRGVLAGMEFSAPKGTSKHGRLIVVMTPE